MELLKHDLLKQLFMSSRKELNLEETQLNKFIIEERRSTSLNTIASESNFEVFTKSIALL